MAVKTSTGTGVWSAGGTWGGSAPTIGTDTVVISAGHTVTYDLADGGNPTPCLQITVNGVLKFDTTVSTKLTMGNASIVISSTGELQIGTAVSPLSSAYTAQILWTLTTDGAYGITVASGGKLTLYGDSATYGNLYCYMADYCQITGDMTTDATGLYFHDEYTYPTGYNGHNVYARTDSQYYIWFDSGENFWRLTGIVGSLTAYRWETTGTVLSTMHPSGDSFGDAYLANGWEAGVARQTFSVIGDTSSWANGQQLLLYNNSGNHLDADHAPFGVGPATISSLAPNSYHENYTDITIVETTYTGAFKEGGSVFNLSRNVMIGKSGTAWTTATVIGATPTSRPILTNLNTVEGNVNINNAMLTGFYKPLVNSSTTTTYVNMDGAIFRHCEIVEFTFYYGDIYSTLMYSCTKPNVYSYA